ncbi:VOC family protein [Aquabacter sp. P-9]|uniref:VOC family protein n=1 Tax=Aquabacter sediminis TaxID=3029197 RepID=UPI00237D64D6|nr:VOC family protein [Aquabacter sp. P-9]MDE1570334.1 VOC family protein [Aquabacter sp. P-9]
MSYLIRQMGHIALATPDPEGSAQDLSDIVGLRIVDRSENLVTLSCNTRRHEVGYFRSRKKAVLAVGLEAMDADAVAEVRRRAEAHGCEILADISYFPNVKCAVRFSTPHGLIFEVHTPVPRDQPGPQGVHLASPVRLEHVNVRVEDTRGFGAFCVDVFGMKLSDRTADDGLIWFRAADGYHHTLAIGTGAAKLHHYGFDTSCFENIARLADVLASKGRAMLWGPGRHGAGNNIFSYYIDPNGCVVETSIEMERIDCDASHEPRTWPLASVKRLRNLWGPLEGDDYRAAGIDFAREA